MKQINNILQQIEEIERQVKEVYEKKGICTELWNLTEQIPILKRELSLLRQQETAVLLEDWQYMWDVGAPIPHVFSNGYELFLIYYLAQNDPKWDGTYVNVIDINSSASHSIALITFEHVVHHAFGAPNDEVINGHPLYEHGLEAHTAHEIIHSSQISKLEKINAVHSCYAPDYWKKLKHYAFTFHDEMFECIARGYKAEVFNTSFKEVVFMATERLFK
ncbi:hypothetical protein ACFFLS_04810 [Flavobacterium procerum]|uniref:Uncharacterized protein n=1 Tax=Flavobacterium procerum TaxID=1455569 RepID=A0ABV6BQM2_9FLAO